MNRIAILLFAALLAAGCKPSTKHRGAANSPQAGVEGPKLTATPNPVPVGSGDGATTIAWSTGDSSTAEVYLAPPDGTEVLFAGESPKGSQKITWIRPGGVYEFRMYAPQKSKLLSTLKVTTVPAGAGDQNNQPPGR